jgi:hypothetical protein
MSKPLGYWGCRYENQLIADIAQHYNELQSMNETDHYWLMARLGSHYWMKWGFESPSEAAQEVKHRVEVDEELNQCQLGCLLQGLGNKSNCKPLGYYSCDYSNRLIKDISLHFGDYLENMNETDQVWLISMLSEQYYQFFCDEEIAPSTAADEVCSRMNELDRMNCGALIQALINK